MQPEPAAVIAWRYLRSLISPAQNTPCRTSPLSVQYTSSLARMYPSSSRSMRPLNACALGIWPMPRNIKLTGSSSTTPVAVLRRRRPFTSFSSTPSTSSTTVLVRNSILSCALARSSMIGEARNLSVRLISVTLLAKRVRNSASSMAESPPPITAIGLPDAKKPSQVAQELTTVADQCLFRRQIEPTRAGSAGNDQRARQDRILAHRQADRRGAQIGVRQVRHAELGTEALGLLLHVFDKLGALNPFRPAGEIFHQRGDRKAAHRARGLQTPAASGWNARHR